MNSVRVEYVLDLDGLDDVQIASACRSALGIVAADMGRAETDIPWSIHATWPAHVVGAARRLCDAFVQKSHREDNYMQTGVVALTDPQVREDFITVAPHAYDATFWGPDYEEVASLADEGQSIVLWLTDAQRIAVGEVIAMERVIRLADWKRMHPSLWRRWLGGLAPGPGLGSE